MSDDLVISSTTDTPEQMQVALEHGLQPEADDTILSTIEDEPPAPVTEEPAPEAVEKEATEEPVEKVEEKVAPKVEAAPGKERPKREDFETEDDYLDAMVSHRTTKRIDRLKWEAEEAKRNAGRLEEENARLKAGKTEKPAEKVDEKVAPSATEVELAKVDEDIKQLGARPKIETFDTESAYFEALADYQDKRSDLREQRAILAGRIEAQKVVSADREAITTSLAEEEAADQVAERFALSRAAAVERHPDFQEKIASASDLKLTGTMQFRVMNAEDGLGHDLAYYFATHRDEAEDIIAMGNTPEALLEIGGIERELRKGRTPAKKVEAKPKPHTETPEPIEPVGGRAAAASVPLDKMSQEEFKATRNRQEMQNRRHARH